MPVLVHRVSQQSRPSGGQSPLMPKAFNCRWRIRARVLAFLDSEWIDYVRRRRARNQACAMRRRPIARMRSSSEKPGPPEREMEADHSHHGPGRAQPSSVWISTLVSPSRTGWRVDIELRSSRLVRNWKVMSAYPLVTRNFASPRARKPLAAMSLRTRSLAAGRGWP